MRTFCEIAKGVYIKTKEVKYIASLERKNLSCDRLRRNAKLSNKIIYSTTKKASKAFVVMEDDTVYYTSYAGDTVANHLLECGKELLKVDTDIYISVQHIKSVFDGQVCRSVFKSDTDNTGVGDLQFLRKRESIKSVLILTTGERIRLSKLSTDIAKEI